MRYLKSIISVIIIISTFLIYGCETQPTEVEKYHPQAQLTCYLFNGRPVEEAYLERVASIYVPYKNTNHGITNADIRIFGGGDTLRLTDDPNKSGRYIPVSGQSLTPKGKTRYRIEAYIPGGEFLWAETVVPDSFTNVNIYQIMDDGSRRTVSDGDTFTRLDPAMYWEWNSVDSAGGYCGLILALTPRDSLVELDPDSEPLDDSVNTEEYSRAAFTVMRSDQNFITIAWLFFEWAGPHRIEIMAISQDYYDYLFTSLRVQQGLIAEPQWNVHGGIGMFSGVSSYSISIFMKRVEI